MENYCLYSNCVVPASFACNCNESLTYFCEFHSSAHLSENSLINHSIMSLEQAYWVRDKPRLLSFLQRLVNKSESAKKQLLNLTKEINKEVEMILTSINKTCVHLKTMIKNVGIKDSISILLNGRLIKNQNILDSEHLKQMKEVLTGYQRVKYKFFQFTHNEIEIRFKESSENLNSLMIFPEVQDDVHEKLYFLKYNTRTLIGFSLDKFFYIESEMQFLPYLMSSPCILQLSKDLLFVHGGRDCTWKNYYSRTFLYDLENESHEVIESIFPVSDSRPILVNDKVFIFGGEINRKPSIISIWLDLKLKQWKRACNLPKPLNNTSSVLLNDEILITGEFSSWMYLYNVENDSFQAITINCNPKYYQLLVKVDQALFIITDKIYESCKEALCGWYVANHNGIRGETLITAGYLRNGFIYFADWEGSIYRFDNKTKSVSVIKTIL